ncbi:amidohydrolase family protein, partial [Peptoniphilus sp. oral taxon 836 str. F0141]|uniref:amidohydrolase n=1 Tax=Peptoniphilus sp. oral taxon 836 TaxID=671216 RepID=UPI0001DC9EE7
QIKPSEVIDGNFLLMTPGFVNGHTHLGMSYFRNYADDLKLMDWLENEIWPIENKLTADDIYWSSLLSICENIKSGVTNFCDMYYEMDRVCDATIISGIRGTLTRGLTDNDGKGKEKLKSVRELYNNYHNKANGRIKVVPAPHAIYTCSENFLREISDLSKDLDGIINIHLSETKGEVENSLKEHGMTPISYVNSLGLLDNHVIAAHCVHITDEEIALVKDKNFYPIYNPTSNLKLASGFTPVEKLLKNNIIMGIGTDGDSSNNSQNLLQDMHIGAIVNKAREMDEQAVKAIEILKMATINGQKALGISKAGLIKEDYLADLTIFNLKSSNFTPKNNLINALVYSATAEDVRDVLCDGKFVMRNRELVNLDEERIKFEVNRHFEELVKR